MDAQHEEPASFPLPGSDRNLRLDLDVPISTATEPPGDGSNASPAQQAADLERENAALRQARSADAAFFAQERARLEAELHASRDFTQRITDNLPAFLAYVEPADLRYQFVNQQFMASFQRTREQIVGQRVADVVGERNFQYALPFIEQARTGERTSYINTFSLVDGLRWIEINLIPDFDQRHQVRGIIVLGYDITARKRAEAALQASEARLKEAQAIAHVGNWELDLISNVLNWSDEIYRIFEIDPAHFGASYEAFLAAIHPNDRAAVNAAYTNSVQNRTPYAIEHRLLFPDGRLKYIREQCETIYDGDGKALRSVGVVQDITQRRQDEEQIKQQLSEITFYFDNAPIGLLVLDTDLRYVRVNKLLAEINGITAADHIGKTVEEVVPDLAAQARELAARILATGEPVTAIELSGETPAQPGVKRYWRESWYPIKRAVQTIIGFSLIVEDITERRQAEEALKQSQQNLARAQQVGRLGSWAWDMSNQTLVWSDEMYRIYGVQRDFPLTYATIEACIHPDDRALNTARVQEALAASDAVDFEFRIVRPDGAMRHIYQSIEITRNEAGVVQKLFGIMQDITERKAATTALKRSEANLQALIENTDDFIASRDRTGRLVVFNSSYAKLGQRMFGVEMRPGLRTVDTRSATSRAHWEAMLDKVYTGANHQEEFAWEFPDETRYYELSLHPIWHEGEVIGSTEFTRDITARKQEEQEHARLQAQLAQAHKMETIGRLAGGIAHDFNNMLAVIMIRTEMALQMAAPATPLHRNLATIYTTAQRSADLVRNLLGFARKQVIAPIVLDINAAIEQTLPMLRQVIGEDIELLWRPGVALGPVKLDPAQVDQMLANLCVNARDVIGGIGTITVETANVTLAGAVAVNGDAIPPGAYVLLAVSDTGGGMDPESFANLFEPFFHTTTVGTGLGLATVDGIVQQNHGYIQVINEPGIGKTLKILFPRHIAGDGGAQEPVRTQALPRGNGETLLLVEDEVAVLNMASEALQNLGYVVITATTAEAAVRAVEEHQGAIDLLITDIVMPKMNGRELADLIAVLQPGIKRLYVSGYPAESVANRGVLEPGTHSLQKPFSFGALASKVREALGQAEPVAAQ